MSLSLFILMLTLFQPWTIGTSSSWPLCPFDIYPSFFEQFDAFGKRYSRLILYFPYPSHGIYNFSRKSQLFLAENEIQNPIQEICMYSLFPSSSHWMCMCIPLCVYPLQIAVSDITKCWIVPNLFECLSQHIQALTPTPGSPFISVLSLSCLGFDTLHWHTPMFRYSPCSQPLTAHTDLPHLHPWMPSSPCLASDFLHKSASSLWISSSLD